MNGTEREHWSDAGFTLIEMMVAIVIAGIVGVIALSVVLAEQRASVATTTDQNITAESRTAINRITEDLAQATPLEVVNTSTSPATSSEIPAITAVENPDGSSFNPSAVTSLTFNLDTDGDGCIAGVTSQNVNPAGSACNESWALSDNPETETICWAPPPQAQLYLIPTNPANETQPTTSCTASGAQALLSGNRVTGFEVFYRSSLWQYQESSGITHWYDLDAAGPPAGNDNGVLDTPELLEINDVALQITLSNGGRSQTFTTEISLRNVHP